MDESGREPQIPRYLKIMETEIEALSNAVTAQGVRIETIMLGNVPERRPDADKEEALVPMAMRIREMSNTIRSMREGLEIMTSRIEL